MSKAAIPDGADEREALVIPGRVVVACTEGLGTSWVTPHINELTMMLSPLTVDLQFDYDLERDRSLLADLCIGYRQPANPELIAAKLATLHFMLFASAGYLQQHGTPTSIDELHGHMFVEQAAPGYNATALDLLLGADRPRSATSVRTNSSLTQAYAAANGAGIALMPSYTRAVTKALIPLPVLPQIRVPVYYYFHAQARQSVSVRTAIDWLKEIFDQERYPWFRPSFVHPDDFGQEHGGEGQVVSLFEHMIDRVGR